MSNIKSFQRLLVVQALYEISINENRKQIPIKEIFANIVKQSDYGKKMNKLSNKLKLISICLFALVSFGNVFATENDVSI